MSQRQQRRLGATMTAAVLLVFAIVAYQASRGEVPAGFPYRANMLEAAASAVGALLVISLLIERAMATLNALIFGEQQRTAEIQLLEGSSPETSMTDLADVLGKKERLRLLIGFVAGVFASAAGARTLEGLFDLSKVDPATNVLLFPVDVLLTAGLLAGGSNGLAYLLQVLKERIQQGGARANLSMARERLVTTS
jgi:hypothetical protein